jgi:hypothetical protein
MSDKNVVERANDLLKCFRGTIGAGYDCRRAAEALAAALNALEAKP